MDYPALDPRSAPSPQLEAFYAAAIRAGTLRQGDRLPPIRQLAERLSVSRAVIQEAYRGLAASGLVSATVGRGTIVTGPAQDPSPFTAGARATFEHLQSQPTLDRRADRSIADFASMHPDEALFPVAAFQESLQRVIQAQGAKLLSYQDPNGDQELRRLLASRVGTADPAGVAEQVLITGGAQQGIDLVLRAFTRPGDAVAVAVPTYHHLFGLLKAHGLRLVPLRSDNDVVWLEDLDRALAQPEVRLVYAMPTFHNPTGRTLDMHQRRTFLQRMSETDVPVLEDEFDFELRFAGEDLPSLRSMDSRGLTVTVRTFSKGLFPGVRLGWLHAPTELLGPMAAMKRYIDLETSPLLQAALLDFLQRGLVDQHVENLRQRLREAHGLAQATLSATMPEAAGWTSPDGGFAFWLSAPTGVDAEALAASAGDRGVQVSPGSLFYPEGMRASGVRLSLSRTPTRQIDNGLRVLAECIRDLLSRSATPQGSPIFM